VPHAPTHIILLNLITGTILGEEYRSLSSSLCSYNHSEHIPVPKHYKVKWVTSICNNNIVIPIVTLATHLINIYNTLPLL